MVSVAFVTKKSSRRELEVLGCLVVSVLEFILNILKKVCLYYVVLILNVTLNTSGDSKLVECSLYIVRFLTACNRLDLLSHETERLANFLWIKCKPFKLTIPPVIVNNNVMKLNPTKNQRVVVYFP